MTVNNKAFASLAKRLAKQTTAQLENVADNPVVPADIWDVKTAPTRGEPVSLSSAGNKPVNSLIGFAAALKKYPAREIGGIVRSNFNPDFALKLLSDH